MLKNSVLENTKQKSVLCIWLIQRQYLKLLFLHIFGAFFKCMHLHIHIDIIRYIKLKNIKL